MGFCNLLHNQEIAFFLKVSFHLQSLTSHGVLYLVSSELASSSSIIEVLSWPCKKDAGTILDIGPSIDFATFSDFLWPHASKTILFARIIVSTPMVMALSGTLSIPLKSPAASSFVIKSKETSLVTEFLLDPGSLNPM